MAACEDRVLLLQGLFDGELDAANALACEAHLKTCPGCRAELERLQAVRRMMASPGVAHGAPDGLRARIEATLDAEPLQDSPRARPRPAAWPRPWAVGGGLAAMAASLLLVVLGPSMAYSGVEDQLVASHVRSLLANHLTDVATSSQHVVRPWFNGRIDFAPPAPELAAQGFPLVGGRLDYVGGRVVAAIVYKRRLHTVNLFVWPARGVPEQTTARKDGYSLVAWTQNGLRFWAVSDIGPGELQQFQRAVHDSISR